jgi:hypothetical protein
MFAIIPLLANNLLIPILWNVTPCDMVKSTDFSKGTLTDNESTQSGVGGITRGNIDVVTV